MAFQDDFYGYNRNNVNKRIAYPFYCNYHNKILIHEYEAYISQMDTVLTVTPSKEQEDVVNSPTKTTENDDNDDNVKENDIQVYTHMDSPFMVKVAQKDNKGSNSSNSVNNKENKGLKVYFEYENKNTNTQGNGDISNVNVGVGDEFDFFKNLEQYQYPLVFGNSNNEQTVMYCGYNFDFFS
jgi:hypothetical protein